MRQKGVLYVGVETRNTNHINFNDISNDVDSTIVELDSCCLLKLSQIQTTVSFRIHMGTTYNLQSSCSHLYSAQF